MVTILSLHSFNIIFFQSKIVYDLKIYQNKAVKYVPNKECWFENNQSYKRCMQFKIHKSAPKSVPNSNICAHICPENVNI